MRRFSFASVVAATALIAWPSNAGAATQIGETFVPTLDCQSDRTRLQTGSPGSQYAAPSDGVITSWSHQAHLDNVPDQLRFKVGRAAGGDDFTIVGQSAAITPQLNAFNNNPTQIPVLAGDVIGFSHLTHGACQRGPVSGYSYFLKNGDMQPGTTEPPTEQVRGYQLDVSAALEPDCDQDGLGDESQDADTTACRTPAGIAARTCKGQQATIIGTPGHDVRSGTPGKDVMVGQGGNDNLFGLGGDDVICGGAGKDKVVGGPGKDALLGQAGKDKLKGGGGRDLCKGGKGNDSGKCEVEKSI